MSFLKAIYCNQASYHKLASAQQTTLPICKSAVKTNMSAQYTGTINVPSFFILTQSYSAQIASHMSVLYTQQTAISVGY